MEHPIEITKKKRTFIFINIIIACIASSMLATALTTALPVMLDEFQVTVTTGQWLTSGYSLAMGIMMPLTAFLMNRVPTRRLYITAIVVFITGLVLSVLAPGFSVLMCGRVLQACGNGILTAMAQVIILTIYPAEQKGSAMGWYGLSVGAAPVIAPTLAGILVDTCGWRMIFYVAIAIMGIALLFAVLHFDDVLDTAKKKFDLLSFALSVFAFGGITLGVGNLGSVPFASLSAGGMLAVGVAAGIVFVYRQLHLPQPFLEIRILKDRNYAFSVGGSMLLYLVMMGSSILLPLYVQSIMGYSATISGLVTLPGSLAMALVSPFAGKLYDKVGMKLLFIAGAVCMLVSNIGMVLITLQTPVWLPAVYNVIRCISIGCLMMPVVTWGVGNLDKSSTPHATALLTSLRTIAGAIGMAVFVSLMTSVADRVFLPEEAAQIYGLNVAFAAMSLASVGLLFLAIAGGRRQENTGT